MTGFVDALAATRTRKRVVVAAAAAVGVLALGGAGLFGARVFAESAPNACETARAAYAEAWGMRAQMALHAALSNDPQVAIVTMGHLEWIAERWRATHDATCKPDAEPAQDPAVAACLAARKLELEAVVDDLVVDSPRATAYATRIGALANDPTACAKPAPGLISARVPADRAVRRAVTRLRYRAFDAEQQRERGQYKQAIAASEQVVAEAKPGWGPFYAETLYLLGTSQTQGSATEAGLATLREAAAVAERVHHDYIAANAWIQLAQASAFDDGNPERALEYVKYADAAVERIGHKPDIAAMLEYVRGLSLVESDRYQEGEVALRTAVEIAEESAPELIPLTIQGLGYVLEERARYRDAVAMFRKALAALPDNESPATEITFRQRLASSLNMLGDHVGAEAESRRSWELSKQHLDTESLDYAITLSNLAQILRDAGKTDEALVHARRSTELMAVQRGERSSHHGAALALEGSIHNEREEYGQAKRKFERACEIIAFQLDEGSATQAECWIEQVRALSGVGEDQRALALSKKSVDILEKAYGPDHPMVANAYIVRGAMYELLGQYAKALPDLERARATFAKHELDPGHLASAEWMLGKATWHSDKVEARALIEQALARFEKAGPIWVDTIRDVKAWAAKHLK